MDFTSLIIPLVFLFGALTHTAIAKSFATFGKMATKKEFHRKSGKVYFFYFFLKRFFPKDSWDNLLYVNGINKQINRILYATTFSLFFLSHSATSAFFHKQTGDAITINAPLFILAILVIVILGMAIYFLGSFLGSNHPIFTLRFFFPLSNLYFIAYSFASIPLLKLHTYLSKKHTNTSSHTSHHIKNRIIELVKETHAGQLLDPMDQKLLVSVANFRERIVREIMVPRIDVTAVSKDDTLATAMNSFTEDGYSRIPVYDKHIDHIIGILLYKDVLTFYHTHDAQEGADPENTKCETLLKPIIYTPETKIIAHLLQEFRNKQLHFAVVVDEYGGTEGIVTIEDILEEIVGEIADEFDDIDEEILFSPLPDGSWVVDAKMSVIDIEKELKIIIPQSPEYDTLGGFIFQKARSIPKKGWKIHLDDFALEVLSSSERSIEKIKITTSQN
jgi:putative hemolysin